MLQLKRYNLINDTLGWLTFVIAAVTYLLTLEPTASFWDCPEFISQGFKLEVGHPPGNPIFMLTARFFVTLFGGGAQSAALAVNTMSALLSAGTILLLFWTVTHLVRKLTVKDDAKGVSALQTLIIMASGLCGALAYTWSDTFWFSAVEGEVYAFSSFCTALVFWLILKWENRADQPHSDRYLVLIAYVIGISIAVHLLNLLCIPAIVLVFYYRKAKHANVKGSLIALALSAVIVFFILYGLVPGFIAVAQRFELLFVNTLGLPFNSGVIVYAAITMAVFVLTVWQLYKQQNAGLIKLLVFASIVLSGMPFVGHGWVVPAVLIAALVVYLWGFCKKIPVRTFNVLILSIMVIFIGYSSYALLLIRASADTPMNQNSPDNVFALSSYLNREQYGDRPLFYGPTVAEELDRQQLGEDQDGYPVYGYPVDGRGYPAVRAVRGVVYDNGVPVDNGTDGYAKAVKADPSEKDSYVQRIHRPDYSYSSSMKCLLPRVYSSDEKMVRNYKSWSEYENPDLAAIPASVRQKWAEQGYVTEAELMPYLNNITDIDLGTAPGQDGMPQPYSTRGWVMDTMTNLKYFLNYQLNHMYWRYFMWNFAGRQNDMQGNGEPQLGNWISGFNWLDSLRLGDQSQLPDEFGSANKGHNVFYMLPLILGLIGLLWQALSTRHTNERRGIEQFWVVFFLFFMTGVAIVLYLNQTPCQPRERDYAFAGSFYAYAIWIGIGVAAVASLLGSLLRKLGKDSDTAKWVCAAVASVIGIAVPVQMVSQTWDDHDRSGRYTARDFGMNYLNSLDPNAIIFTNGDNDTFPLWYAQEVEGERTDVKVVNLSYLSTDWYANQVARPSYDAQGVPMYAGPQDYAYDQLWLQRIADPEDSLSRIPRNAAEALPEFYAGTSESVKRLASKYGLGADERRFVLADQNLYAQQDSAAVKAAFGQYPDTMRMDLGVAKLPRSGGLNTMLTFDIVAKSASNGWKRPVYFATTVPNSYYLGFEPYMYSTGMAKQVTPFADSKQSPVADRAYRNIMSRWRWGNLDTDKTLYLDETVRRMVSSTRLAVLGVVEDLLANPTAPASDWSKEFARKNGNPVPATQVDMARNLMMEMDRRMPVRNAAYESMLDLQVAEVYTRLWAMAGNKTDLQSALQMIDACKTRYGQLMRYANSLTPAQRNRMGASERQAMSYLTIAVGLENYIKLRQAMVKAGAPAEELAVVDSTLSITGSFEAYDLLYLMDATQAELSNLAQHDSYYIRTAQTATALRSLHNKYHVATTDGAEAAAKRAGISVAAWRKLVR